MKKVITYGTFDLFHQGHYNILKRAKEHGDYLIVGVTGESYDIERGKLSVQDSLLTRIENVRKTGLVDEIIVEEYLGQKTRDIERYNIDVFVIGSDWEGKFDHLRQYCEVVYLERTKNISSTILRAKKNIFKIGAAIDDEKNDDLIEETKNVSGLHVESVYSEDLGIAEMFCRMHSLDSFTNQYNTFLDDIDIVFIKTDLNNRYKLIKEALLADKYVVCDFPFTLDVHKTQELFELAEKCEGGLLENISTIYLRAFNQLVWMAQGNVLGNIYNMKSSISKKYFKDDTSLLELLLYPVCATIRILGSEAYKLDQPLKGQTVNYVPLSFEYKDKIAWIDIGTNTEVENQLMIVGEKGTIIVKEDWWNTGFFELDVPGEKSTKKFSFNFEGSGLRYLLQELLILIRNKKSRSTRLFDDEALAITEILSTIALTDGQEGV